MKLLYINDAVAICGGLERVLVEKMNWFVEHAGYEVCLLTTNQCNHPFSFHLHPKVDYRDLGVNFHQQYQYSRWRRILINHRLHRFFRQCLAKVLLEYRPDVIICVRLDFLWDIVKVKNEIPCIFESHSSKRASYFEGDGWKRRLLVWYMQRAVKKVEQVVALTKGDANEWQKLTSKVCVIPNLVHLNDANSVSDCILKTAIYVGRYSKQKDIGILLQIWELVNQRHPDWELHIYAGYGEQQVDIIAKINNMKSNIIVHNPTTHIFDEYLKSSMLLLTSIYEPFGLVLPEAMSCGLPVVSFASPYGPSDIITEGFDGFLIQNRSIEDFVEKVCYLIDNSKTRIQMGNAVFLSSKRYSVNKIMPQWKCMFERIVPNS